MPHKRAKRSVREKNKREGGHDLIPEKYSLANEAIPKSAARAFNAEKVRAEFKAKKRSSEDDGQRGEAKRRKVEAVKTNGMSIKPGESLTHFNKRVEDSMRGLVRSAVQTSNATARAAKKEIEGKKRAKRKPDTAAVEAAKRREGAQARAEQAANDKHADRPKEFQQSSTAAPRRLNDIAQAPPDLKKLPRGAAKSTPAKTLRSEGVVSMAQKVRMEEEREKAIERYRLLRASQRKGFSVDDEQDG
ncbi:hypothetical protein HDZ31DRAFT_65733 [Schizophyllum fasciatum]